MYDCQVCHVCMVHGHSPRRHWIGSESKPNSFIWFDLLDHTMMLRSALRKASIARLLRKPHAAACDIIPSLNRPSSSAPCAAQVPHLLHASRLCSTRDRQRQSEERAQHSAEELGGCNASSLGLVGSGICLCLWRQRKGRHRVRADRGSRGRGRAVRW